MKKSRLKVICTEKTTVESGEVTNTEFVAVNGEGDNEENKEFFKYSPNAHIRLGSTNPAANELFVKGESYYIDIIPVKQEEAPEAEAQA